MDKNQWTALIVIFAIVLSTLATIINNYEDWQKPHKWAAMFLSTCALVLFNYSVFQTLKNNFMAVLSEAVIS